MKTNNFKTAILSRFSRGERGQSLLMIAFLMVGMIGMLILVLDGGQAYMNRRQAQNAADAGAYAGAAVLCAGGTGAEASFAASQFAEVENYADSGATLVNFPSTKTIEVIAYVSFDTFFGNFLGRPSGIAEGRAVTGCLPIGSADGVLPVAFSCRNPDFYTLPSHSEDCQWLTIPHTEVQPYEGQPWDISSAWDLWRDPVTLDPRYQHELYVVMDSTDYGTECEPTTVPGVDCDFDNDGEIDIISGNDRGWLNLDGGNTNSNELQSWIDGSEDAGTVYVHSWYPGRGGTDAAAFDEVGYIAGTVVLLPVIDGVCPDQNVSSVEEMSIEAPECFVTGAIGSHPDPDEITQEDDITYGDGGEFTNGQADYYHVIGFVAFYISCVQDPNQPDICPGYDQLLAANPTLNPSLKTIEGYILAGYTWDSGGVDPDAADTGVNIILLQE